MAHWGGCNGVCPHGCAGRAHWPVVSSSSSKEKAALWRTAATPHGKGGLPQLVVPEPFIKGLDTRVGPESQTSLWFKCCSSPQGMSPQKSLVFACENHYRNCNLIQNEPLFYLRENTPVLALLVFVHPFDNFPQVPYFQGKNAIWSFITVTCIWINL